MSFNQYQWCPPAQQAPENRATIYKIMASIELTYLCVARCNVADALLALHHKLITQHCELVSAIHQTSSNAQFSRRLNFHLSRQLWHVTRNCSDYLERHGSPTSKFSFTYQAYQGFLSIYGCAAHAQCVWIESIASTAMTARRLWGSRFENWDRLARIWCRTASDANPTSGECLLSLARLENAALRQLYFFSKSLLTLDPLAPSSRQLMMGGPQYAGSSAEALFIQAQRSLLMRAETIELDRCLLQLQTALDDDTRVWPLWHRSAMLACIMCASLLDFGNPDLCAFRAMSDLTKWRHDPGYNIVREFLRMAQWDACHHHEPKELLPSIPFDLNPPRSLQTPNGAIAGAAKLFRLIARAALGTRHYQFAYIVLSFIFSLSHSYCALTYLEAAIPWSDLVSCLNQMRNEIKALPQEHLSGPLREDFMLHGYMWSWMLFRPDHFLLDHPNPDHMEEAILESAEVAFPLLQRCIQLAHEIVKVCSAVLLDMYSF
jgi:hypothetical protein